MVNDVAVSYSNDCYLFGLNFEFTSRMSGVRAGLIAASPPARSVLAQTPDP